MPFTKGQKKQGGRTKGTSNKTTQKVRDAFALILEDNLEQLEDDLASLKPEQRVRLLLDLAKYIVPQLKQTEFKNNEESPVIPTINFTGGKLKH
jgi:hypothetical protein